MNLYLLVGRFALLLADVLGATPCNVAQRLAAEVQAPLLTGANLPMLLKALTYRAEAPAALV